MSPRWPARARLLALALLLASPSASAGFPPVALIDTDVGLASEVLLARWKSKDHFVVVEVFRGTVRPGELLVLPVPEPFSGDGTLIADPPDPPFSKRSTVLLFLSRKGQALELVATGGAVAEARNAKEVQELRAAAREALTTEARWQEALAEDDPVRRRDALWPWAERYPRGDVAMAELIKLGPLAGDLLAEQLEAMPSKRRAHPWLPVTGEFKSEKLRTVVLRLLPKLQAEVEAWQAAKASAQPRPFDEEPSEADREAMRAASRARGERLNEVGSLLHGLFWEPERRDLPLLREVTRWEIAHADTNTYDLLFHAFQLLPARENLGSLEALGRAARLHSSGDGEDASRHLCRALESHKYPETVELLAKLLASVKQPAGSLAEELQRVLTSITGLDLGRSPEPWLAWARHHPWGPKGAWTEEEEPDWEKLTPDVAGLYSAWLFSRLADVPDGAWVPKRLTLIPGTLAVEVRYTGTPGASLARGRRTRSPYTSSASKRVPIAELPGLSKLASVDSILLDHSAYR